MREIKFRAWNKVQKVMFFPDGMDLKKKSLMSIDRNPFYVKLISGWNKGGGFELMQYTGLKDKNGKEIYEGDIVKDWENIDLYEVVWNRRYACFELNRLTFGNDTGQEIDNSPLDLEIVGNIYENKDLLEAKEI